MRKVPDLGPDPERAALLGELLDLHGQVHDQSVALAGPMPLPPDLTMQQVRVLGHVAKEPGLSGHELGERLGVSAPTASGLVDRLVEKGLITRADDLVDRRVRRLHPTAAGLKVIREMDSMFDQTLRAVTGELSLADLKLLRDASTVMLDALRRAAATPRD